jgi:glycosyltransferase involved in cell wall biosynthesis
LRTATAVVSTNESFRDHALRRGVPARRVAVVRNGPSIDEVAGAAGAAGAAVTPVHRIVYLGVLGPQDNVEAAILAADELIRRRGRTGWRMTIAGDGESLPGLTRLVSERGLGDVVEFTGWLDGHRVDELLRSATIAIQPDAPTRMNDLSTMAKTVEYVARGIPVVAADMVETRRTAGEAAVYVPNGSAVEFGAAIHELLDDPDRRGRMRAAGLERFANGLSWERQGAAYLQVWHQVLGRSTSPQPPPRMPRQRRAEPATALLDDPADAR